MARPTGLISDVPSVDDHLVGSLIGYTPRQLASTSLVDHFRFDLDQWPNQTCVQFSMANAVWAAQGIAGILESERILISPPALYYYTLRRTHGAKAVLADLGSKPSQCVEVLNGHGPDGKPTGVGCPVWEDWPHEPDKPGKCLTEPPGNVMMCGTDQDWVQLYRLDGWGLERKEQVIGCMCADVPRPVICGLTLDKAYEDLKDKPWPGRTGPTVGRHMVALCGFDEIGPFVGTSWGPGWAQGGLGQITWEALMSLETTDLIAVSVDVDKMPKKAA